MVRAELSIAGLPRARTGASRGERAAEGRLNAGEAEATCAHCGLPARAPRRSAGESLFCCPGCRLAWSLTGRGAEDAPDRLLARIVLSAFLAMGVMVASLALYGEAWGRHAGADGLDAEASLALRGLGRLAALLLTAPIVLLLGVPLLSALVRTRRWLSSEGLVLFGVGAAFATSVWNAFTNRGEVYFETTAMVLTLVALGRWIEARAKETARERLTRLLPEREEPALRRIDSSDELEAVPAAALAVDDRVRVRPGALVPADGVVVQGRAFLDSAALTGESTPRAVGPGERVLAGSVPLDGALELVVEAAGDARLLARVERLLEEALATRAPSARLADRVAGLLLPLVALLTLGTIAVQWTRLGPERALFAGLAVALIACPCALGIATPLAFWVALGRAWRRGVLIRGAAVLESMAGVRRVFLDKTGTLTHGALECVQVSPLEAGLDADDALRLAAALEEDAEHPIGHALVGAARARGLAPWPRAEQVRALAGEGIAGQVCGRALRLVRACGAHDDDVRTRVQLEGDGRPLAEFALEGAPRAEARAVVDALRGMGLEVRVLSGDAHAPAAALGRALDIAVEAELSPADKLARVRAAGARTLFVGDGWNDSAALAAASVGVSVSNGVGRSLEAAGVHLVRPGLDALPVALRLARRAVRTARLNLAWAFGYNALFLGLATTGRLSPIFAAAAMVLSSVFVVLQSFGWGGERNPGRTLPRSGSKREAGTEEA